MRLRVLGASGVAGRAFVPLARGAGHDVRSDRIDVLDPDALMAGLRGIEAVINVATAIPRVGGRGDWALNDRIRREGTAHVLAACVANGVRCLVQQSLAMLHTASDIRQQHEDDRIEGRGVLASALDMERLLQHAPIDVRIVRGGLFRGGDSGAEARWQAQVSDPQFRIPGNGDDWVSLVHVEDYAQALRVVLERGARGSAYIACDDQPLRWRELYASVAARAGVAPPPTGGPPAMRSFRTCNARLRALGWVPLQDQRAS